MQTKPPLKTRFWTAKDSRASQQSTEPETKETSLNPRLLPYVTPNAKKGVDLDSEYLSCWA